MKIIAKNYESTNSKRQVEEEERIDMFDHFAKQRIEEDKRRKEAKVGITQSYCY